MQGCDMYTDSYGCMYGIYVCILILSSDCISFFGTFHISLTYSITNKSPYCCTCKITWIILNSYLMDLRPNKLPHMTQYHPTLLVGEG